MEDLLYSPYDIAYIISKNDIGVSDTARVLNEMFIKDNAYIEPEYCDSKPKFMLAVMDMLNYINNKDAYESEAPAIKKDAEDLGINSDDQGYADLQVVNLFFKEMRLNILYSSQYYTRLKLRTLLANFGYKRRSESIVRYIRDCLMFYHIKTTLRGNIPCDIEQIGLDEMVTFRVI